MPTATGGERPLKHPSAEGQQRSCTEAKEALTEQPRRGVEEVEMRGWGRQVARATLLESFRRALASLALAATPTTGCPPFWLPSSPTHCIR